MRRSHKKTVLDLGCEHVGFVNVTAPFIDGRRKTSDRQKYNYVEHVWGHESLGHFRSKTG